MGTLGIDACCWLLVVGCWLLVVGCWLLVVGCWLLVVCCWLLLVVGCWLLVVGCWLLVVGCWLLVVGCWLLVVGCWLLVVGCWLLVVRCALCVVVRCCALLCVVVRCCALLCVVVRCCALLCVVVRCCALLWLLLFLKRSFILSVYVHMPMADGLAQSPSVESLGSKNSRRLRHLRPSITHNCECSRAPKNSHRRRRDKLEKIANNAKCVNSRLRAMAQLSELSCDLASRTSSTRHPVRGWTMKEDRTCRTATALSNLKKPGSPTVAPTVRYLK